MLQDQGEDLDHLAVAARLLEQMLLQDPEGLGSSAKGAPLRRAPGLRWTTAR